MTYRPFLASAAEVRSGSLDLMTARQVELYYLMADVIHLQNRYDDSAHMFRDLANLAIARQDALLESRCLRALGHVLRHQGRDFETAMYAFDDALLAGVCGYVLKVNAPEELERAIAAARAGQRYLSPEANAALLDCYQRIRQSTPSTPPLSPREREVVRLIAAGRRTKEIADGLGISIKSAETYRRRLMQKLGLFSVAELTRYALREGLISADD